jgi:ribosomal protein S18 acetylase RimI-like enzyme
MLTENQISIRLAGESDLESLVAFNLAMAEETESKQLNEKVLRAGVLHLLKNPRYGFYVVAEDAAPEGPSVIGSLMVTYEWSDWRNALFWWIQSVYVKPPYRRRGIYRRLYAFVKECANKEKGVCGFRLYVEKENSIAQQTYRNLGMEESHYLMFEEGCTSENWE